MDLHFLIFLFPAGVVLCFRTLRDEHIFVIIYAVVASYFAGVMVRLMLTLTPVVCVSAAVALSSLMDTYLDPTEPDVADEKSEASTTHSTSGTSTTAPATPATGKKAKKNKDKEASTPAGGVLGEFVSNVASSAAAAKSATSAEKGIFGLDTRLVVLLNSLGMLLFFVVHCTWVTSNAYSSPSVVLSSTGADGSQHIIDDFREAYYWLRQNTAEDAVVMSWWDYGYQIAGMADRPTLVDNNTWNNSGFSHMTRLITLIDDHSPDSTHCDSGQSHVIARGNRLPYSAQTRRQLRPCHIWRCDWVQRRRHQQVPLDGAYRAGCLA
jgi:dolichyl-diphosphooligosaccharide--protein glycosyltransferase